MGYCVEDCAEIKGVEEEKMEREPESVGTWVRGKECAEGSDLGNLALVYCW